MKKKLIIAAIIVGVLLWMGITLAGNKQQINEKNKVVDRSYIPVTVAVKPAAMAPASGDFTLPAVVEPIKEADVSVSASGKVNSLSIELGSVVRKGQVLGEIDSRLKELNLKSTQLTVNKLGDDYKRYQELYKGNAATETNVNDFGYNYEIAKVQAEQIRQQIADGRIISPLNGIVVRKNIEAGEYVNPGGVIATIVDVSELKANVLVNEKNVYKLKVGNKVEIQSDIFPGKTFSGVVRYISPKGDESHNYPVEVSILNKDAQIKAGTFVRVNFDIQDNSQLLQIPKIALAEGVKNPYVYIVKDNKAVLRKITVGREIGDNIEVVSGLSEGESVVTTGQINLVDGSLVEVIQNL